MTKHRKTREDVKTELLAGPAHPERKYLKDVLPRLYHEAVAWLADSDWPELVDQLPSLFITDRCNCGSGECSQFFLDSEIPKLSRELGSTLLQRPLYYDMGSSGLMIGLSGAAGLTPGQHTESYVSSFELSCMRGGDYEDRYVHRQLEAHDWTAAPDEVD